MNARIQQAFSLLLALAALALLARGARADALWPWLIAALAVLLVLPGLSVLMSFVLLPGLQRGDPSPPLSMLALCRAALGEWAISLRVFLWRQPWAWGRHGDHLEGAAPGRHGVVFLHGYFCNRGLWNPWLARLRSEGRACSAVTLEPAFGSIDDYAPLIDAAVRRVQAASGRPPVLVCHSMGGLAARAWLRQAGDDTRVARVVTLGTPHHGTRLAERSHARNGRQMRRASPWLQALAADETAERRARFICWYSNADNIVLPATTATLAGADNRFLPGVGHVAMVESATVRASVQDLLDALDRAAADPRA